MCGNKIKRNDSNKHKHNIVDYFVFVEEAGHHKIYLKDALSFTFIITPASGCSIKGWQLSLLKSFV